jgi:hypothetical protein
MKFYFPLAFFSLCHLLSAQEPKAMQTIEVPLEEITPAPRPVGRELHLGSQRIRLPLIEDFWAYAEQEPGFRAWRDTLGVETEGLLLALRAEEMENPETANHQLDVQIERKRKFQRSSPADIAALRAQETPAYLTAFSRAQSNDRLKVTMHPAHDASSTHLSRIVETKEGEEESVVCYTTALLGERLVHLYATAALSTGPSDVLWVKQASQKWLTEIQKANGWPVSTSTVTAPSPGLPEPKKSSLGWWIGGVVCLLSVMGIIWKRCRHPKS